jgi:hypothetical protein
MPTAASYDGGKSVSSVLVVSVDFELAAVSMLEDDMIARVKER